jgi:hypothetical protein
VGFLRLGKISVDSQAKVWHHWFMLTTQITAAKLKAMQTDIYDALVAVGAKHGVTLTTGNTKFSNSEARTQLIIRSGYCEGQTQEDLDKAEWDRHCPYIGMKAEDFGQSFQINGRVFTICQIKPNAHSYPIIGKGPAGGKYKFAAAGVKVALAQKLERGTSFAGVMNQRTT